MSSIKAGLYRHYKGAEYQVYALVRHSETEENLVLYKALYGDYGLWVRPFDMFTEMVSVGGNCLPRFKFIKELPDNSNEFV
tara:strand:+ start:6091 stop:6333 length:243 start_codon:yes stop_codon:yes gene_type:complete